MVDTVRTLTVLQGLLADNVIRAISEQDHRDVLFSALNIVPYITKSANYTATQDDGFIDVTTGGGTITITLPAVAAVRVGQRYVIRKADAAGGSITIDGDAAEEINGVTTKSVSVQYDALEVINTGAAWAGFDKTGA